jgi:hypothetical protein
MTRFTLLLLIICYSVTTLAAGTDDPFFVKDDREYKAEELKAKKEVMLLEESIIEDVDKVIGVKNNDHFTKWDNTRFTLSYQTAADITKIKALNSFDIKFQKKMKSVSSLWWSLSFRKTLANFDQVSENSSLTTGNDVIPETTQTDINQLGFGIAYRFKFLFPWREAKNWFEEIHVIFNATSMTEAYLKNSYSGYGLITEYEVYKRSSKKLFYGAKLIYSISDVSRTVPSGEDLNKGRLLLAWLSLGFNIGFYF